MSKKRYILSALVPGLLFLLVIPWAFSQERDTLRVADMKFCTTVENREPVGVATVFADTVGQVYCFTLIEGAKDTTTVTHVWYHGTEKKAEVELRVASDRWRTWSSKRIMKEWTGRWRVEVVTAEREVLRTEEFDIESQSK